jgi:hypothetical protein
MNTLRVERTECAGDRSGGSASWNSTSYFKGLLNVPHQTETVGEIPDVEIVSEARGRCERTLGSLTTIGAVQLAGNPGKIQLELIEVQTGNLFRRRRHHPHRGRLSEVLLRSQAATF